METLLPILRRVGLFLTLVGATLSLWLMFRAGQRNESTLLMTMFTIWVALPFICLVLVEMRSSSWTPVARLVLYATMETIAVISVIAYSGILNTPDMKNAFMFLVVPAFSLAIIAVVFLVGSRMQPPAQ
ncbi:MAG: hypothetical protein JNL40_01310 [Cyclobacteriaceae bacterium]|nr:hypothetical protein [Cyclobacteriaceae bacterium]